LFFYLVKMKKIIFVSFLFVCVPFAHARAALVFSEVMYDPPGTQSAWIEVYNNGTQSVDLTKYFLYTDGGASTRHSITQKATGTTLLPGGAYAIIADDQIGFNTTYPNLLSVDSSFSIPTTRASVFILTTDTARPPVLIDDQMTLDPSLGAKNDGNSLQKNSSGMWVSATPTPGAINAENSVVAITASSTTNTTTSTSQTIDSSSYGLPVNNTNSASPSTQSVTPQVQLFVPKNATAGISIEIIPQLAGIDNPSHTNKSFHISLGDGTEYDYFYPIPFRHTYKYPGTYVVTFEYRHNPYDENDFDVLSARKIIEITSPSVVIHAVNADGSIELANTDTKEIDISNWMLQSVTDPNKYFVIPKSTILLAGKKIILPVEITGFENLNTNSFALYLPGQRVATDVYGVDKKSDSSLIVDSNATVIQKNISAKISAVQTKNKNPVLVSNVSQTLTQKDVDSAARATSDMSLEAQSNLPLQNTAQNFSWPIAIVGIGGMLLVAIFAVKNKKSWSERKFLHTNSDTKSAKELADEIRIIDE